MSIPDAAIEAAARAWAEHVGEVVLFADDAVADHNRWSWQGIGDGRGHSEEWKDVNFRAPARAAIEAAMPAIREAIAQEIESAHNERVPHLSLQRMAALDEAARIVRGGTR